MDFNEAYDDTNTSVGLAARMGNMMLLKELLENGRPTNGHDNRGWRPLHEAAHGGHVECVRLLLTAEDSELDALTHERTTALLLACKSGTKYYETVKALLSAGADPNMEDGDNWELPLTKAVAAGDISIVKLLLDAGAEPNMPDCHVGMPLHIAAEENHCEIAELLIEKDAYVDYTDEGDRTALHALFSSTDETRDRIPLLNLLLEKGCDVNAAMTDGTTPLMLAVQLNDREAVMRLLECSADPSILKQDHVMALHFAVEFSPEFPWDPERDHTSNEEIQSSVLKKILDLTDKSLIIASAASKYSLFHLAIQWNKLSALKLLIDKGISPDVFLQETASAVVDEEDVNLFRLVPLVINLGPHVDTPLAFLLSKPLTKETVQVARFLIEKGSSVNPVNELCLPPLVAAVKHQRATYSDDCPGLDILEYLLNNGADIYYKIRKFDVLPAALYISSLFNASAFFTILQWGVPVHEIYTLETLEKLSKLYENLKYYAIYPLFPWRVISWLHVLNMFIPQLPLHTKDLFDITRTVEDENLTAAWNNLNTIIESPKKLQSLCVMAVRRAVGDCKGWSALPSTLKEIKFDGDPLPPMILECLQYKQIQKSSLYHMPPVNAMVSYVLPRRSPSSDSLSSYESIQDNEPEDHEASDGENNLLNERRDSTSSSDWSVTENHQKNKPKDNEAADNLSSKKRCDSTSSSDWSAVEPMDVNEDENRCKPKRKMSSDSDS